jgi:hypothetical protein
VRGGGEPLGEDGRDLADVQRRRVALPYPGGRRADFAARRGPAATGKSPALTMLDCHKDGGRK